MPEEAYGPRFMLQEHARIIDAYHDLHAQKNELIKFYLAFASLPAAVVAIFLSLYKYLVTSPQLLSAGETLKTAGVFLAILLIFIGIAVLIVMLKIRGEQYLYVKTINGVRKYFKEEYHIDVKYLVLPSDLGPITFGQDEVWGRAFWETMIIGVTTSMLLAFVSYVIVLYFGCQVCCILVTVGAVFLFSLLAHILFVTSRLRNMLREQELLDISK